MRTLIPLIILLLISCTDTVEPPVPKTESIRLWFADSGAWVDTDTLVTRVFLIEGFREIPMQFVGRFPADNKISWFSRVTYNSSTCYSVVYHKFGLDHGCCHTGKCDV
jgi:hypothetical protein